MTPHVHFERARTITGRPPDLQSFGLTVLEAEKWRSSNQVEIKILLCKLTLQIPKIASESMYPFKQKSFMSKIQGILSGPKKSSDIANKTFLFEELH